MVDVANATKLDLLLAQIHGEITVIKLPRKDAKRGELLSHRNKR